MTDPVESPAPHGPVVRAHPGRALGIVSLVLVVVCAILPASAIFILMETVDPLMGWYLVALLPVALIVSVLALVLAVIGWVAASKRHAPYGWPLAGALVSGGILLYAASLFFG